GRIRRWRSASCDRSLRSRDANRCRGGGRTRLLDTEREMTRAGGRPVVLLHGCGGSFAAAFESTGWIEALRAVGRTPVKIHLPGHGVIPAPHDPAYYADLAGLVMKELPAGPFDAV